MLLQEEIEEEYDVQDKKILTPKGWKHIKKVYKTVPLDVCVIRTKDFELKCSINHLVVQSSNSLCIPVNQLQVGTLIDTQNGHQEVLSIEYLPEKEVLYDITIDDFTIENYKDEITDLVGIRVIHIFKEDWEEIHDFITKMWNVKEIVANIRKGDNTKTFEELGIEVCSRLSGYRSVHYLVESYPTTEKVITEVQVRTIFEEGYGEIDHQLRYSLNEIPEILEQNLMLLNRIAGSSDEMASLINLLSKNFKDIESEYNKKI